MLVQFTVYRFPDYHKSWKVNIDTIDELIAFMDSENEMQITLRYDYKIGNNDTPRNEIIFDYEDGEI